MSGSSSPHTWLGTGKWPARARRHRMTFCANGLAPPNCSRSTSCGSVSRVGVLKPDLRSPDDTAVRTSADSENTLSRQSQSGFASPRWSTAASPESDRSTAISGSSGRKAAFRSASARDGTPGA